MPADYPREAMLKAGFKPRRSRRQLEALPAVGCSTCNNGYKGRVGIYQVMPITEEIQQHHPRRRQRDGHRRAGPARRRARSAPVGPASRSQRADDTRRSDLGHERVATGSKGEVRASKTYGNGSSSAKSRDQGHRLRVGRQGQERQGRPRRDARRRRGHGQREPAPPGHHGQQGQEAPHARRQGDQAEGHRRLHAPARDDDARRRAAAPVVRHRRPRQHQPARDASC